MSATSGKILAVVVHVLTGGGAIAGLLALVAIGDHRFPTALGWMFLAVVIDGVDGTLARRLRAAQTLPQIDGALLDNLVDYLNYVVVPAYLIHSAALLPTAAGLVGASAICLVSALQFSQLDAKTSDFLFKGFPSYWNIVAFYLLLLHLSPWANLLIVAGLCLAALVPVYCVYPTRTPELRAPTLALTGAWAICLLVLWLQYPAPQRWLVYTSLAYVVYYAGLSLMLTARRRIHPAGAE